MSPMGIQQQPRTARLVSTTWVAALRVALQLQPRRIGHPDNLATYVSLGDFCTED